MHVVAIIQARMGSSRLPGKVMLDLCGKTVLEHDLLRVKAAKLLHAIVVATTVHPHDDRIATEASRCGVEVSRGSEEDVLARYYQAALEHRADIVVRITSDCPLFDPDLLDHMLEQFLTSQQTESPLDYMSNTLVRRTFPRGLDAEIFSFAALEKANREATENFHREHVTPYLYQHPDVFNLGGYFDKTDNSRYRWTLDTDADLELIRAVYKELYREGELFTTRQVLDLMAKNPQLVLINAHIEQKKLAAGQ